MLEPDASLERVDGHYGQGVRTTLAGARKLLTGRTRWTIGPHGDAVTVIGCTANRITHVVRHVLDALLGIIGNILDGLFVLADVVACAVEAALWEVVSATNVEVR